MEMKLSYNASNFRVRLSLTVNAVKNPESDPHVFLQKTHTKLQQLVQSGDIDIYYVYEHQFLHFWAMARNLPNSDKPLIFDLGFGARKIDIQLGSSSAKSLATIKKIEPYQPGISLEEFNVNLLDQMKMNDADESVSDVSLRSAYYRWCRKALKTPFPIFARKTKTPQAIDVSATINRSLREAYLYVGHSSFFQDKDGLRLLYNKAKHIFKKIKKQLPSANFMGDELMKEIKEEQFKISSMGADLPKVFLFAMEEGGKATTKVKVNESAKAKGAKNPKNALFKIKFSNNDLEARIAGYSAKVRSPMFTLNKKELIAELQKYGIVYGYDSCLDKVLTAIDMKQELKGMLVARGKDPLPGTRPFLYESFRDSGVLEQDAHIDLDMREAQNRSVVNPGDIIAEVRFQDGRSGKDVFGNTIHATAGDAKIRVHVGPNVEKDEKGRYVSLIHGMPTVKYGRVDVSQVYIHKGDINLSSGNIFFEGSAEIRGNVESGASITVAENLLITGTVGQCSIKVGGDLIVKGGIVTTDRGLVQVRGKLVAGFVENSRIITTGDMIVSQSVMNSAVIVGGILKIVAPKTGVVGGGVISVRNRLITGNLGFDDGKKTICRLGADWKIERKIAINEARLHRLDFIEEMESKNLKEARAKEQRKLARKGKSADEMKKRLDRISGLKRKIERKLKNLRVQLTWNKDSIIIVQNVLSTNVDITVGGKGIVITEEIKEVMITYHKMRDSRINPLDFLVDFDERVIKNAS